VTSTFLSSPKGARGLATRSPAARVAHLAHLGLDELRTYRQELIQEEAVVSYWRRVVHARIDGPAGTDGHERLRSVLAGQQDTRRRVAHLVPYDGSAPPPMPDLAVLWESAPDRPGEPDRDRSRRLVAVEAEISAYRRDLHERLDEATGELIARYREEPALALRALPRAGGRGAA
jgi:hypothetical protein